MSYVKSDLQAIADSIKSHLDFIDDELEAIKSLRRQLDGLVSKVEPMVDLPSRPASGNSFSDTEEIRIATLLLQRTNKN